MTYVLNNQQTVAQNNINAPQLLTQNIQDPVALQNFEILNKFFMANGSLQQRGKANIVFSPVWTTTIFLTYTGKIQVVGQLQLQITTYGNPVRIKLAPSQIANPGSGLTLASLSGGVSADFGWYRNGTQLCQIGTSVAVAGNAAHTVNLPLPAFEYDDIVPSGTYTYQFYVFVGQSNTTVSALNLQAVAYELR